MAKIRLLWVLPLLSALAGCMVGPDYHGAPKIIPSTAIFHNQDADTAMPGPVRADWWVALHDPQLDVLIVQALAANPDLQQAQARLRQSRELLREQRADLLPSTSVSALYLHSYTGGDALPGFGSGGGGSNLDFYDAGFDATWEIDIFGGQRRAVEAARANMAVRQAQLADTQVSLTADVAQAYIDLRDAQARMALLRQSAALEQRMVSLTQTRESGGTASALDVLRLRTMLDQTQSSLPPLQAQEQVQLSRLAMLTGQLSGALDAMLQPAQPLPMPPNRVAIGDPGLLLRQRPDIRAAERALAASNAQIGQHVADLFPKLELLGNIGFGSADLGQLIGAGALTGVAAPVLQWKPLDFGRTWSKIGQAKASRDEAVGHYRQVVLAALDDAESSLARYGRQREQVVVLGRAADDARHAANLMQQRLDGGTVTTIDQLDTERQLLQADQDLARAKAVLTSDFISLQKSLGLGWAF